MCRFHRRCIASIPRCTACLSHSEGMTIALLDSVRILVNAIDWYFMIAAPTVLAVIALRATGLSRR